MSLLPDLSLYLHTDKTVKFQNSFLFNKNGIVFLLINTVRSPTRPCCVSGPCWAPRLCTDLPASVWPKGRFLWRRRPLCQGTGGQWPHQEGSAAEMGDKRCAGHIAGREGVRASAQVGWSYVQGLGSGTDGVCGSRDAPCPSHAGLSPLHGRC